MNGDCLICNNKEEISLSV